MQDLVAKKVASTHRLLGSQINNPFDELASAHRPPMCRDLKLRIHLTRSGEDRWRETKKPEKQTGRTHKDKSN
ncbi:hypothetical protein C0Q70_09703 [Pomacea canaliculata]|uniref:Uncharacterized protein n=1 Tax=Pomacea canaliculata TaxID=400727 RepID=A0A2T7PAJ7_POMCA|nr:hypothetical protein C0Q70_09703 [Pomacea canaliculata]